MGDSPMTVSGLGSAYPRLPVAAPARTSRPERAERTDFDHLTGADRELIFRATGQRVDPSRESPTGFATALAAERASGRLALGQPVTAVYLKDLNRRFTRAGGANPVEPYLEKALDYLSQTGPRRIDVTA
jgi:hypothetical protein